MLKACKGDPKVRNINFPFCGLHMKQLDMDVDHNPQDQCSCLGNQVDRGAPRVTVRAVTVSWAWLSNEATNRFPSLWNAQEAIRCGCCWPQGSGGIWNYRMLLLHPTILDLSYHGSFFCCFLIKVLDNLYLHPENIHRNTNIIVYII